VRGLSTAITPMTNTELTAKRADDSMSMVAMVLYSPLIPTGDPVAARTFLPCRTSRTTIMRVRRMLSDNEIEMYGRVERDTTDNSDRIPIPICGRGWP